MFLPEVPFLPSIFSITGFYLHTLITCAVTHFSHHWGNCRCCCRMLGKLTSGLLPVSWMLRSGAEWNEEFSWRLWPREWFNGYSCLSLFRILFWDPRLFLSQPLGIIVWGLIIISISAFCVLSSSQLELEGAEEILQNNFGWLWGGLWLSRCWRIPVWYLFFSFINDHPNHIPKLWMPGCSTEPLFAWISH